MFASYGYDMNSQQDELSVGLLAQLEEHCTNIADVMVQIPSKTKYFILGFNFTTAW